MSLTESIREALTQNGYEGEEVIVSVHNVTSKPRRVVYKWDHKNSKYFIAMVGRR